MKQTTLQSETIYQGRIFSLEKHQIVLPNGESATRELIQHNGAAAVVALTDNHEILLVQQYRIGADAELWEIPAGLLDPAETPLDCAIRELQEETGYKPGVIESLGGFYVAAGYTSEYIHLFTAKELVKAPLPKDTDEFIRMESVPVTTALDWISTGQIVDSKTIIGLLLCARHAKS
jgi:ADP-ribose pyrophosphatase